MVFGFGGLSCQIMFTLDRLSRLFSKKFKGGRLGN